VTKAGRVLSTTNEAKIRGAVDALTQVLNTLPAPADDAAPVAKTEKEATMADTTETTTTDPVVKAKGDPQVAVYTEDGKLVGTVDQTDISPIASATPPTDDGDGADAETPADATTETPAADPATPAAAPAPAEDAATIPGTDTVQSPAPAPTDDVTKSIQASMAAALEEVLNPIAKQLGETAGLSDLVKNLQERVEHLAAMPDDRRSPAMNGATGASGLAPRDGSTGDPLSALKKAVEEATDPVTEMQARTALAHAAILQRFQLSV
ncbi:MAG TPA: hypothetical protein VMV41_15535, partial [Cellulomonadaceae bacterium]|nr:hypothetical protein [Cellulomonadaceae bacterium]